MDITALLARLPLGDGNGIRGAEAGPETSESFARVLRAAADGREVAIGDPLAALLPSSAGEKSAALPSTFGGRIPDSVAEEIAGEDGGAEGQGEETDTTLVTPLATTSSPQNFSKPVAGESTEVGSPRTFQPVAAPLEQSGPQSGTPLRDVAVAAETGALRVPVAQTSGATAPATNTVAPAGAGRPMPELARAETSAVPIGAAAEASFPTVPSATSVPASTVTAQPGEAAPSAPATSPGLQSPVASQPWGRELGQQLLGLVQRGDESVELQLNPRELGPLSVNLTVDDQGARAQFFSAHAAVRGAVEQAIPQLRDALAQQGITLGEAAVGEQQQQRQGAPDTRHYTGGPDGEREAAGEIVQPGHAATSPVNVSGGVDLYA